MSAESEEMAKVEIVLSRDGTLSVIAKVDHVSEGARGIVLYGMLQRALMDVHKRLTSEPAP